ncbi:MAG: hypothetical protein DRG27_04490 [Deltaproteobacteria bacterium]|nr:MAG: hypothetical protein DRG27_04490 [Deltaproteobacteria bacterium]
MPGLDGTGPWGLGPMTGRGLGLCNPYGPFGRGWWWRGRGFGFGRGWGRGFGWRWRWFAPPYAPYPYYDPYYEMTPEDELEMLRKESEMLKRELDAIEKRIAEIEAEANK